MIHDISRRAQNQSDSTNSRRVSVVTITYDDLEGLRRTRESVAGQCSRFDIEHVIVDGGSGSDVVDYLRELPNEVVWVSELDAGRYDAMNKGARLATGDVMWFMHSGDVFASSRSVDLAVSQLNTSGARWGYGLERKIAPEGVCVGIFGDIPFSFERLALGGFPVPHQACFFESRLVTEIGGYSLSHGLAADQLFILACAALAEPVVVAEFLCDFDVTGVGSVRPVLDHFIDMRRARRALGIRLSGSRLIDDLHMVIPFTRRALGRLRSGR